MYYAIIQGRSVFLGIRYLDAGLFGYLIGISFSLLTELTLDIKYTASLSILGMLRKRLIILGTFFRYHYTPGRPRKLDIPNVLIIIL